MLETIFTQHTASGLLVVYRLPHWSLEPEVTALTDVLHAEERARLEPYAPRRRVTYAGGRYALRSALTQLGATCVAIGSDDRGAPMVPDGYRGSISHKDAAVAALAQRDDGAHLGVDLEEVPGPSDALAEKILTPEELRHVAALPDAERALELALRFSLKEAIYKALDPYVRRYVGYREVEVWPDASGGARVVTDVLPSGRQLLVTWRRVDGYVLTTARL